MKHNEVTGSSADMAARLLVAVMLLLVAFGARADYASDCTSRYAQSGAIQGTKWCPLDVASNSPGGPGGYACLNDVDLIKQWCTGTTDPEPEQSCPVADPVYPGSGAVTLTESDFVSGDDIPMVFTRTYRSKPLAKNVGAMGPVWFHSWQRNLDLTKANSDNTSKILAYRGNGEPVTFKWSAGTWRTSGFTGLAVAQNGSGWTLTDLNTDTVESYSAQGVLLSESTKTGFVRTLTYGGSGQLTTITQHAAGTDANNDLTLRLDYDDKNRLSRLNDPLGRMTQYAYGANDNLVAVTWPDGYVHRYVYDDARFKNALTGEIDESGNRVATWSYDAKGRAVAVTHPDTARNVRFAYNSGSTVIAGSKGATTLNMSSIGGVLRPTGTTSAAGNSSSTWDASGNLLKDADASGGTSEYGYDDSGRPVKATVKNGSGTSISTIRYADAFSLRPSMIASPGLIQSFVYDAKGNVTGVAETPTSDATGATGFAAPKADRGVTVTYGMTYDATNRLAFVQQQADGKVTGQWRVTRDVTGNAFAIIAQLEIPKASKMIARDAAHRVLYGYNATGDFYVRYDQRARIDSFTFYEYASAANGGISRVLKVRFNYSPDGQVISRTGTVAKNGSVLNRKDGSDIPIPDDEINQWIDNYNYGDSPVGPPANLQGASQLLRAGPAVRTSTVCSDCHFSAGLIDGPIRGIAYVWRLAQNPMVRYGIGQGARKVAEKWERIKEMCKPAVETEVDGIPRGRITSEYIDITTGGSIRNIRTDVGKAEFEANLVESGYVRSLSKDGRADIFSKDGARYTVREESSSGYPTAEYVPAGAPRGTVKIRLPK
jgi:YD repeat-containing protein